MRAVETRLEGKQPVIKPPGPLRTILACLAEGDHIDGILQDFPTLTEEDVHTVIAFATASAEEGVSVIHVLNGAFAHFQFWYNHRRSERWIV